MTVPVHSGRSFILTVYDAYGRNATCQAAVNVLTPVTPQHPIVYPPQPYVSLAQIPYTGFDLGPWGNAMYWLALLMFAGSGAYLVLYYTPVTGNTMRRFIRVWALKIDKGLGFFPTQSR